MMIAHPLFNTTTYPAKSATHKRIAKYEELI